jgi:hypothetical protein
VLLEDDHVDARAREQQAEHHGRPDRRRRCSSAPRARGRALLRSRARCCKKQAPAGASRPIGRSGSRRARRRRGSALRFDRCAGALRAAVTASARGASVRERWADGCLRQTVTATPTPTPTSTSTSTSIELSPPVGRATRVVPRSVTVFCPVHVPVHVPAHAPGSNIPALRLLLQAHAGTRARAHVLEIIRAFAWYTSGFRRAR